MGKPTKQSARIRQVGNDTCDIVGNKRKSPVISMYYRTCLFLPISALFSGDPLGARTQDPNIKSVVLYLLS